jgi:hypothetical protein
MFWRRRRPPRSAWLPGTSESLSLKSSASPRLRVSASSFSRAAGNRCSLKSGMPKQNNPIPFLSIQLPDGTWVAVELRPGQYATGKTQAQAEAAIRRQVENPAATDDDAADLAAIELHRHERMIPFEQIQRKYRK